MTGVRYLFILKYLALIFLVCETSWTRYSVAFVYPVTDMVHPLNVTAIILNDTSLAVDSMKRKEIEAKYRYALAESSGELADRLRVLAAYMHVAEYKYNARLAFIWEVNEHCPGHFHEIFQSIPSVTFATNSSRYVLDKGAVINYEASNAVFTWTMQMNEIPKARFGSLSWKQAERNMYNRFIPIDSIVQIVYQFVLRHNICQTVALLISARDIHKHANHPKLKKRLSIDSYYHFVESTPPEQSVYLITDSPAVQLEFLNKYGDRKIILRSILPIREDHKEESIIGVSSISRLDKNLLQNITSQYADYRDNSVLQNLIIEVLIGAHSQKVKGTPYSSLTDLVNIYKSLGYDELGWCKGNELTTS